MIHFLSVFLLGYKLHVFKNDISPAHLCMSTWKFKPQASRDAIFSNFQRDYEASLYVGVNTE